MAKAGSWCQDVQSDLTKKEESPTIYSNMDELLGRYTPEISQTHMNKFSADSTQMGVFKAAKSLDQRLEW